MTTAFGQIQKSHLHGHKVFRGIHDLLLKGWLVNRDGEVHPIMLRAFSGMTHYVLEGMTTPQWTSADFKTVIDIIEFILDQLCGVGDLTDTRYMGEIDKDVFDQRATDLKNLEKRTMSLMTLFVEKMGVNTKAFTEYTSQTAEDPAARLLTLALDLTYSSTGSLFNGDAVRYCAMQTAHHFVQRRPKQPFGIKKVRSTEYWYKIICSCERPYINLLVVNAYALYARWGLIDAEPPSSQIKRLTIPAEAHEALDGLKIMHHLIGDRADKPIDDWKMLSIQVSGPHKPTAQDGSTPQHAALKHYMPEGVEDEGSFLLLGPQQSILSFMSRNESTTVENTRIKIVKHDADSLVLRFAANHDSKHDIYVGIENPSDNLYRKLSVALENAKGQPPSDKVFFESTIIGSAWDSVHRSPQAIPSVAK